MVWGKGWGRGVGGGVGGMFREKQHALNKGHRATVARLTADQKVGSSSLSALIVYTSPRMGAIFRPQPLGSHGMTLGACGLDIPLRFGPTSAVRVPVLLL